MSPVSKPGPLSLFFVAVVSCSPRAAEPRVLELVQVRPERPPELAPGEPLQGVFLNESLVLHFSEALDPTSVHSQSVRIVASDGTLARGALRVQEKQLVFLPAPVLAADLSDGGYRPGETYELQLAGFPRPDGLRSRTGAPLSKSMRWSFRTVELEAPRRGIVFEDASLEEGRPVVLRSGVIGPSDAIRLEGEEPLDPATLVAEDFDLRRQLLEEKRSRVRPPLSDRIALHARLVENYDKHAPQPLGSTWIELVPLEPLQPGRYLLLVKKDLRLRDLGNHRVAVLGPQLSLLKEIDVRGEASALGTSFRESFLTPDMRSLEPVPRSDGTATWSHSGRVEVHWPRAAGSGEDGLVVLEGAEVRRDVQATRLEVPAGVQCSLEGALGCFVLRAQGRLTIAGALVRRAQLDGGGPPGPRPSAGIKDPRESEPQSEPPGAFLPAEDLSGWLVRARADAAPWTVLIAGGDLDILGPLRVDGPLLLVAGGRIRLADSDLITAPWLYTLGEGGANVAYYRPTPPGESARPVDAVPAPLVLDLADANMLAVPLVFAVRSGPIPSQGSAKRWHPSAWVGAHSGAGTVRVSYVGERANRAAGEPAEIVAENPVLLGDCPTLRIQFELELMPGTEWDPPWIDEVELGWEPAEPGRER